MAIKKRKRPQTETKKRSRKKETENIERPDSLLPTGCTLLNCSFSDHSFGGYRKGTIVNLIGDSSAGKTLVAYTSLAAMAADDSLSDYRFILDDAECAGAFDIKKLFGNKLASRIEPPGWHDKEPRHSETVQDFHMFVKDAIAENKPFIYILDSWDAVDSEEDQKHVEKMYKDWKKDKTSDKGSYGTAKAKMASSILRNIKSSIKKTESLVIIISQVRENLNAGTFGSKKTRSGGKALKHYSWQEIWLYLGEKIKHSGTKLQQGVYSIAKLGKNRQTGKLRDVTFPIYYDLGVDDIAANITFLDSVNYFKKKKQTLIIPELDFEGAKYLLLDHIEKNNLEIKLQEMVHAAWNKREEVVKLERKRRFE